jgi:hypothetical protein
MINYVKRQLPAISDADRTPLVDALLELLQWQLDRIKQLEDDIQRLNKQTRKPNFTSSKIDQQTEPDDGSVNKNLLLEQLHDLGIDISSGQLRNVHEVT